MKPSLDKAENLFQSLQRRYELRQELEEADRAEAMAQPTIRIDAASSKSSQKAPSSVSGAGDSTVDGDGEDGSSGKMTLG